MAAAATSRWLGFRCRLCLKLRGQRASPCGQIPCCRFYSGSATLPKVEGTNITGIEEVVIPRKKTCDLEK
uniref:Pentatricopeptide repeat domain 3 n=1 Tax=Canis lupus familiaris TaxID=9615 RepID=A0A8C0SZI8_CANLF